MKIHFYDPTNKTGCFTNSKLWQEDHRPNRVSIIAVRDDDASESELFDSVRCSLGSIDASVVVVDPDAPSLDVLLSSIKEISTALPMIALIAADPMSRKYKDVDEELRQAFSLRSSVAIAKVLPLSQKTSDGFVDILAQHLAQLRGVDYNEQTSSFRVGNLDLYPKEKAALYGDKNIKLSPSEYELLEYSALHFNQIMKGSDVLEYVFGQSDSQNISALYYTYQRMLARKLRPEHGVFLLKTAQGMPQGCITLSDCRTVQDYILDRMEEDYTRLGLGDVDGHYIRDGKDAVIFSDRFYFHTALPFIVRRDDGAQNFMVKRLNNLEFDLLKTVAFQEVLLRPSDDIDKKGQLFSVYLSALRKQLGPEFRDLIEKKGNKPSTYVLNLDVFTQNDENPYTLDPIEYAPEVT